MNSKCYAPAPSITLYRHQGQNTVEHLTPYQPLTQPVEGLADGSAEPVHTKGPEISM